MSLIAFEDAVRAHFANPPATWHIQPDPEGWNIVDAHGAVLDTCATAVDRLSGWLSRGGHSSLILPM